MTNVTVIIEEDTPSSLFAPKTTRMARMALPRDKKIDTVRIGCEDGTYLFAALLTMVPEDNNASKPEQTKRR